MFPSNKRLKPFNSNPIEVEGHAICPITFGSNSVLLKWHIVASDCETILAGTFAADLGIIDKQT